MLKLDASVALSLIFCSTTALAREPEVSSAASERFDEQPRTLRLQPLESDLKPKEAPPPSIGKAQEAASDGVLSPFTTPAAISSFRASAQTYAGYDSAASSARARAAVDGRLTNFLALRVEFDHGPATGSQDRLSVGARFAILKQRQHGIDLGAGLFYQPKDFRAEGNVVGALLVARHFGRLGLFVNALFGSDPEGDDQSLELRLGSMYTAQNWLSVGFDARSRFNFSKDEKRSQAQSVDFEMQAAPSAIFCLGPLSLMALVGPSVVKTTPAAGVAEPGGTRAGLLAMAGAGGAF
ncbi:MAG TPA: hypothetical protein VFK05_12765 [Polyangiaceae bacterium]|nr:hypothetical protein [Polyangiaceae bacterium]